MIATAAPWAISGVTAGMSVLAYRRAARGVEIANDKGELEVDGQQVKLASDAIELHKKTVETMLAAQEARFTDQLDAIQAQVAERDAMIAERDAALVQALSHIDLVTKTLVEFIATVNGDPVPPVWLDRLEALTNHGG